MTHILASAGYPNNRHHVAQVVHVLSITPLNAGYLSIPFPHLWAETCIIEYTQFFIAYCQYKKYLLIGQDK